MEKQQALDLKHQLDKNSYLKNISLNRKNEYMTKWDHINDYCIIVIQGEEYILGSIVFAKNKNKNHPKFNEYYLEIFVYDLLGITDILEVYDFKDGLYIINTITKFK